MSVQPAQQLYHAHPPAEPNQIHSNGVHSASHPYPAPATNGHTRIEDMNPFHQHQQQHQQHQQHHNQHQYATGYGAPPPQRQYSNTQLPPMFASNQHAMAAQAAQYPTYPTGPAYQNNPMPPPPLFQSAPPAPQPMLAPMTTTQPQQEQHVELSGSGQNARYQYALLVEQQPLRARMCGFGDKDRRPITPPPCIRLVITDLQTGKPAQLEQSDGMFFVLQVDLWNEDATKEVNIVRSSSSSPAVSISTATTTSYPPPPDRHPTLQQYTGPDGSRWMYDSMPGMMPGGGVMPPQPYQMGGPPVPPPGYATQHAASNNSTMFTRNLIGSLTVNAAWLKDLEGNYGFWFVLQDLSVRTEGFFRLRMNFIDVKDPSGPGPNRSRAPCLAFTFSDRFQVFSAKKFPGVIESTALSKCFASQGIKIPIRKDVKVEKEGDEDEEDA